MSVKRHAGPVAGITAIAALFVFMCAALFSCRQVATYKRDENGACVRVSQAWSLGHQIRDRTYPVNPEHCEELKP